LPARVYTAMATESTYIQFHGSENSNTAENELLLINACKSTFDIIYSVQYTESSASERGNELSLCYSYSTAGDDLAGQIQFSSFQTCEKIILHHYQDPSKPQPGHSRFAYIPQAEISHTIRPLSAGLLANWMRIRHTSSSPLDPDTADTRLLNSRSWAV
jgi:hypothetical protein